MEKGKHNFSTGQQAILILSVVAPLFLYLNRHLDDNRLTSWSWVFDSSADHHLPMLLGFAAAAALVFSRVNIRWTPLYLPVVSFLAVVPFWSTPEVIVDAARYFTQAKHLENYGFRYFFSEWGRDVFAWTDLPLAPLLYGTAFRLFGESRIWVQFINSLFFSGTVIWTYLLGRRLWGEELGRHGAFLLLGMPYLYTQVGLTLVDVPTMFFLTGAVYLVCSYLQEGGGLRLAAAALVVFGAFFVKYSAWMFLSVLGVVFVIAALSEGWRTVTVRATCLAALVLLFIGTGIFFLYDVMREQVDFLATYQKPGLKRWGESFASTFLFQVHPLLTAAAIFSAGAAVVKRDLKYLLIGFLVLLLVILQVKRARYVIPVFPMLALMSSYGIMHLRNPETRRFLVALIVLSSFAISLGGYLPFLRRMSSINLQRAGEYLEKQEITAVHVLLLPQQDQVLNPVISLPLLDIYTNSELHLLQADRAEDPEWNRVATSSLRFTWEYPVPAYYTSDNVQPGKQPVVIIGAGPEQPLPQSLEVLPGRFTRKKVFSTSTGKFTYKTDVTVYH